MARFGAPTIELKTDAQLADMARAGVITSRALDAASAAAVVGATTADVDAAAARVISEAGAKPNFLGYHGYPATVCASVNEEVVHGIPGPRVLQDGDILSIDCGSIVNGWHSDSARTVLIGNVSEADRELSEVTRASLWHGIAAFAKASRVGEIGDAIDDYVRGVSGDYGILEDYVGHGIGSAMHMAPDVLNYRSRHRGPKVQNGMALAIEPMLVLGGLETEVLDDDWTVVTADKKRAAHWEHSVAKHKGGIWVLTAEDGGAAELAEFGITPQPIPA